MSEKTDEIFFTKSNHETQKLGEEFAKHVKNGGAVLLYGNLGAGKTTFVQGLAKGLGIEKRVISPTFVILRTYQIKAKSQKSKIKSKNDLGNFYHVDLYRLEGSKHELEEIGLLDLLKDQSNIFAIEWPEKMKEFLPNSRWEIYFESWDENRRKITVKKK
jgi:tRNA threonylcarbamoyladenosine biosynthesis protein TsaE